jgi:sulfur carrier protein ThiS
MVYLWKKNGVVYHHTDLEAAVQIDGLTAAPDMTVEDADFEAAEGIARLVNGKIVLGKTVAEKQAEENQRQITVLKQKLADTDYISAKIAEGSATIKDYADQIAQRQAWRQEINRLAS